MVSCPQDMKEVPLTKHHWLTEYLGYGNVDYLKSNEIFMSPKRARTPQSTHATLVLSNFTLAENFDLIVEYKNNQALREQTPNPWEVFWLFFQYQKATERQKLTNYVVAKPNGIELGKAFDEEGQEFLKTASSPTASFNEWHQLRVKRENSVVTIYFDEKKALEWKPSDTEQQLFNHEGYVGLYSEDASVTIRKFCANESSLLHNGR